MTLPRFRIGLFHAIFFLSGAAGLGCQVIWSKMFALGLGHEISSMLAVVTAFFLGMSLGAKLSAPILRNTRHLSRCYGVLEVILGVWGIVSIALIPAVNEQVLHWVGIQTSGLRHWGLAFLTPAVALLPATMTMGATLPALEKFLSSTSDGRQFTGSLYAMNTIGAAAGALASAFWLMPQFGFSASLGMLAGINLLCGVSALFLSVPTSANILASPPQAPAAGINRRLYAILFAAGFLGIAFEVLAVRVLAQVLENTIFTFAAALAIYLLGTAAGAWAWHLSLLKRKKQPSMWLLLSATGLACGLGMIALAQSSNCYTLGHSLLGDGYFSGIITEISVAAIVFGPVTFLMGATFTSLCGAVRQTEPVLSRVLVWNNLGAALAGVAAPLLFLPVLGSKWSLFVIGLGYLALAPFNQLRKTRLLSALLLYIVAATTNTRIVEIPAGGKLLAYSEGVMASVSVTESKDGHRSLRVNNRFQMGGTAVTIPQRRQADIPLLLHPNPRRALFLGPGTGITLGAGLEYPGLLMDGVELMPEVVNLMPFFEPQNGGITHNNRVRLTVADARRFIRVGTGRYDVIIADLFHPSVDGTGALYTREHFRAVRERLNPHGLFCQWLPLHQLDEPSLKIILRTFLETFPDAKAWLLHYNVDIPVIGLIGGSSSSPFDPQWVEQRLGDNPLKNHLREVGLNSTLNLLGTFAADSEWIRAYSAGAKINTDDDPLIIFTAGKNAYSRPAYPHKLLFDFLPQQHGDQFSFITGNDQVNAHFIRNLADYIHARDVYLRGLASEVEGQLQPAIEMYLQSAGTSLYFTPAYARCVTIIEIMSRADMAGARSLFRRLEQAQPAQPLGRKLLGPRLGITPSAE